MSILGKPAGMLKNIGGGVEDLFYEVLCLWLYDDITVIMIVIVIVIAVLNKVMDTDRGECGKGDWLIDLIDSWIDGFMV
jgi:hypothetical protein